MMYLHDEPQLFAEVIQQCRNDYGYDLDIIEKDYYVSMFLQEIAKSDIDFVFKGGTSLSKCYSVIERFSEDIDLTVMHKPNRKQKSHIKQTILDIADKLGLVVENKAETRSGRDFNRYEIAYSSILSKHQLAPVIYVEVSVSITAFPIDSRYVSSYVGQTLSAHGLNEQIQQYNLHNFVINVQSIKRTFIDKVFALCDYYLQGKKERYSRHIYDIYQIMTKIDLSDINPQLIEDVKNIRRNNPNCLSAKENVNPTAILAKLTQEEFYKDDYNKITKKLLFTPIPYEQAIIAIEKIIKSSLFTLYVQ